MRLPTLHPTAGTGERASLVYNHSVNSNSGSTNSGAGDGGPPLDISSSSGASSVAGGQDVYGSLAVGDAGSTAVVGGLGTGVDRFPEVRARVGEEEGSETVVKLKKEKNINMEAAVLHAVTDLVGCCCSISVATRRTRDSSFPPRKQSRTNVNEFLLRCPA